MIHAADEDCDNNTEEQDGKLWGRQTCTRRPLGKPAKAGQEGQRVPEREMIDLKCCCRAAWTQIRTPLWSRYNDASFNTLYCCSGLVKSHQTRAPYPLLPPAAADWDKVQEQRLFVAEGRRAAKIRSSPLGIRDREKKKKSSGAAVLEQFTGLDGSSLHCKLWRQTLFVLVARQIKQRTTLGNQGFNVCYGLHFWTFALTINQRAAKLNRIHTW